MAKTADRLLAGVKRRCIIPSSQVLLQDSDILALADDVIEARIIPLMISLREDFFVVSTTQALTSGTAEYDIPYRSIGRTLRDLKLYDGSTYRDMSLIAIEDEHFFTSPGTPQFFYFKGDKIVCVPSPNSATPSLQIWYDLKPNRLVKLSQAGTVTASTSTTVTVSSAPSDITTSTTIDFIQAKSGNTLLAMDKTISSISGNVYTFAASVIPSALAVGDYLSVSETAPVVMLPSEVYQLLETGVALRVLKAIGDSEGARDLERDYMEEEKNVKLLLAPRIQGENTVIMNRRGLLRGSKMRYRKTMTV